MNWKHIGSKRAAALALAVSLLILAVGCNTRSIAPSVPEIAVITTADPASVENVAPQQDDAPPTPTPKKDAAEAERLLTALDEDLFRLYVTNDGFTLHQMLRDPAAHGITADAGMMTWGDLSLEGSRVYAEKCAALQTRLGEIDRDALSERSQLSYDVIEQYLDFAAQESAFEYYYEPLESIGGLQSQLPLALSLYAMETTTDVENYLLLLADVPRYFEQILAYERERASLGLFMTQKSLSDVVADCNDIIDSGNKLFLKTTFADAIDQIKDLTKAEKKAYRDRNETLLKDALIPAYTSLRDGLQALSAECRASEGMNALGENGLSYFALRLQMEGCTLLTPEDALSMLDETLQDLLQTVQSVFAADSSVAKAAGKLTSGKASTDLALVQKTAESILPKLPAHTVTISDIPKELGAQFSAAAYVIPPIDDWKENTILINPAQEDDTMFLTLAHEGYPGHLYQYVYQRSLEDLGLTQRALPFTGCVEGWAQYAEELIAVTQEKYDQNAAMFHFCNSLATNTIIPAIVSIDVNYFAYERDDVVRLLTQYGLDGEAYASTYYNFAVENPFYPLAYAIGYAQLSTMMRDMSQSLEEAYLQQEVLTQYLDYGPSYFNLISERMDEWADAKIKE